MKKVNVFSAVCLTFGIILAGFYITNSPQKDIEQSDENLTVRSSSISHQKVLNKNSQSATQEEIVEVRNNVEEKFSDNFDLIASTYAEEIKFPPYSLPLTNDDRLLLKPNFYQAQSLPLEDGGSATIELDQYRFIYPQPINVRLQLKNIKAYDVHMKLFSELDNTLLDSRVMIANGDHYQQKIDAASDWDGPMRIEIEFKKGSQSQIVQTGFEYVQPVAKIIGVGDAYIEGVDLVIPVKLHVSAAGHYRLRANLFSNKQQPLAVLTANSKLGEGAGEIKLRVFKTILKRIKNAKTAAANTDSLWLSTFQLENRSSAPGEPTRYGDSDKPGFEIHYPGLDSFSDGDYTPSEEELHRLEFLQQMATQK